MMKQAAFFLALAASSASALELSPDNFAAETDGKSVLLKFFAPWVSNECVFFAHAALAAGWSELIYYLQYHLTKQLPQPSFSI